MVHDPTSRAAARDLLAESDVVPSGDLTDAVAELKSLGERPVPAISPALSEAMRQAVASVDQDSSPETSATDNVVALRFGKARRRGAAVGGAVVLAMAAGMGGVAAFGPDNPAESAIESVIGWVAPTERTEPASDDQPAPALPESVPAPEAPPAAELPAPAPSQDAPEPANPLEVAPPEPPARPETPAPTTRDGQSKDLGEEDRAEVGREAVPPVEIPELPVPLPGPVTTPRAVIPVDPPQLPVPGGTPGPAPRAEPSR